MNLKIRTKALPIGSHQARWVKGGGRYKRFSSPNLADLRSGREKADIYVH
jgi:hypothetical protein